MDLTAPRRHGPVAIRLVRQRDARVLQQELLSNRAWLRPWEATSPDGPVSFDMRMGVRRLLQQYRDGAGVPFVMEYDGEVAGQLNVWGIARGSLASATIGYWVSKRYRRPQHHPDVGRDRDRHLLLRASDPPDGDLHPSRERREPARRREARASATRGCAAAIIHIDGDWRDHYAFALVREEVPEGVLQRWVEGRAPQDAATVPPADRLHA